MKVFSSILIFAFTTLSAYALSPSSFGQVYFIGDSITDSGVLDKADHLMPGFNQIPTYTDNIPREVPFVQPHQEAIGWTWPQWLAAMYHAEGNQSIAITPNNAENLIENEKCVSGALHGNNFAQGGAVISGSGFVMSNCYAPQSLSQQITHFLTEKKTQLAQSGKPPLVFIWGGNNDFIMKLGVPPILGKLTPNPVIPYHQYAEDFIAAVNKLKHGLDNKGYFVIIGLPNLTLTPLYRQYAEQHPSFKEAVETAVQGFNNTIKTELAASNVYYYDTYAQFNDIVTKTKNAPEQKYNYPIQVNGVTYQVPLSHPNKAACPIPITMALLCNINNPNKKSYIFADIVHPMGGVQEIIAAELLKDINGWQASLPN